MKTSTPENIIDKLSSLKWNDGYTCRKCGHDQYKSGTKTEGGRKCKKCDTEESLKRYTVFDNSKIPLEKACMMFQYLVKTCRMDEDEKWFKAGSLAYKDEKDQFEQRLTAVEFVNRKNERIGFIQMKIDNMDSYMERWSAEIEKNMDSYKEKHPTSNSFQNDTRFTPIARMLPTYEETQSGISYKEFLKRANEARHRLQLVLEGHENFKETRVLKYLRTKKPGLALLARKFELEENTIAAFMKKVHERFKCFDDFRPLTTEIDKVSHHDDVISYLHESKYRVQDYFGLFMFPLTVELIDGEVCIDRKWYKLETKGAGWSLCLIHYTTRDPDQEKVTYYNKPGEEEYICTNPDDYDGHLFDYPYSKPD